MKIRLAKKIMKQQVENCLPAHKRKLYWLIRWDWYESFEHPSSEAYCVDHRITKAISLTSKNKKHDYV